MLPTFERLKINCIPFTINVPFGLSGQVVILTVTFWPFSILPTKKHLEPFVFERLAAKDWIVHLLVGGLGHLDYFSIIYGNSHPNWLSYFSEGLKPPTSLQQWEVPLQKQSSQDPRPAPEHWEQRHHGCYDGRWCSSFVLCEEVVTTSTAKDVRHHWFKGNFQVKPC